MRPQLIAADNSRQVGIYSPSMGKASMRPQLIAADNHRMTNLLLSPPLRLQ